MSDAPPRAAPHRSKLALFALVSGILGLLLFPFAIAAVVLGVMALVKMGKDRALTGKGMAIASLALAGVAIPVQGCLAAIAIPAFVGYVNKSRTSEVHANLAMLQSTMEARVMELGPESALLNAPLTPSEVPCGESTAWPADAPAGWTELGFAPGKVRYSYEVASDPASGTVVLRARGDLDCDGQQSLFEMMAHVGPDGRLERAPGVNIQQELE